MDQLRNRLQQLGLSEAEVNEVMNVAEEQQTKESVAAAVAEAQERTKKLNAASCTVAWRNIVGMH